MTDQVQEILKEVGEKIKWEENDKKRNLTSL